ncbi:MAG: hypothetical protein R3C10_23180 [Pirellulales bacterium]
MNLSRTRITDAALANFTSLANLRKLELRNTDVGDVGLDDLASLVGLKDVDVTGTRVSATAMLRFERLLPNCRVAPLVVWRDEIRDMTQQGYAGRVQLLAALRQ